MRYRAALLPCVLVLACSPETPTTPTTSPSSELAFELTDIGNRISPEFVNAHVHGSFALPLGSATPTVITTGPANFPGHPPAGPGTCDNGTWINQQGKRTAGTLDYPHPHCLTPPTVIEVVLEPISACYSRFAHPTGPCAVYAPSDPDLSPDKHALSFSDTWILGQRGDQTLFTRGFTGPLTAYAIDASTLGGANRRVGTLSIDIQQQYNFNSAPGSSLFQGDCLLDDVTGIPCLNQVIFVDYTPLETGGVGVPTTGVPGFLYFVPADAPFNYGS
jgi:hypothetical protein